MEKNWNILRRNYFKELSHDYNITIFIFVFLRIQLIFS